MIEQKKRKPIRESLSKNTLDLSSKQIGDDGVQEICASDTMNIKEIYLFRCNLSSFGIAKMSLFRWTYLKKLNISTNRIANLGCKYLSRMSLNNLIFIDLTDNHIESSGILHLSKAQWMKMCNIRLSLNKLSTDALKWFVKTNWANLRLISLVLVDLTLPQVISLLLYSASLKDIDLSQCHNLIEPQETQMLARLILARFEIRESPNFRLSFG